MSNVFINHLMECARCNGGVGRYCDVGKLLMLDCDSNFYAEALAKIPDRPAREAYMAKFFPKQYFDLPALTAAVIEKYKTIKNLERELKDDKTVSSSAA